MKVIRTHLFDKIAKSKYPKSETGPYNPWAVCNKSTGGEEDDPEKFERCVHHLKDQNRKKNKKEKDAQYEGEVYTPAVEDSRAKLSRRPKARKVRISPGMPDDEWLQLLNRHNREPAYAEEKVLVREAQIEGRYENVVFMQGDDALDALNILDQRGEEMALKHLKQWHYPGKHMKQDQPGYGEADQIYNSGPYIMSYNTGMGYIGLSFDTQYQDSAVSTDTSMGLGDDNPIY